MAGINILIQIFTSFMSCLIIKSFLDDSFIKRTIKNKTIFLWIFYFLLSLYCENNNNITLPKLFLSAAGVLVICLIAYDGKLHKKIAMVFLYHFIWIAIEMLLGYTIMSVIKGNDYANFELLCSIICKIIMLALVKIIPLFIDPSIECDMPSKYVLEADISIRDEEKTEKGKFVAKAKDILMSKSEKEVKYLVKVLECAADNLDQVISSR